MPDDEQYFATSPSTRSRRREVRLTNRFLDVALVTDRGVFSADRVDLGTRVLLDVAPVPPDTGTFVDLGCGYGPIALSLAAASPAARVVAVDTNERARALTAENAERAGLANVEVLGADEWTEGTAVDLLWSNPPIRIGKRALRELLTTWLSRLAPAGSGLVVVQRNLGADSLQTWLDAEGWKTDRVASKKGYRVLRIEPASD